MQMMKWVAVLIFILSSISAYAAPLRLVSKAQLIAELNEWENEARKGSLEAREKDLQIDFILRLKFQCERKFSEGDAYKFFLKTLEDMQDTDELKLNRTYAHYDEFLSQLRSSLKELFEPGENVINFVRSYVKYSSMHKPKSYEGFADQRNYFNGKVMQSGQPLSLEDAGDVADKKLKSREVEIPDYLKIPVHFEQEFQQLGSQPLSAEAPTPTL